MQRPHNAPSRTGMWRRRDGILSSALPSDCMAPPEALYGSTHASAASGPSTKYSCSGDARAHAHTHASLRARGGGAFALQRSAASHRADAAVHSVAALRRRHCSVAAQRGVHAGAWALGPLACLLGQRIRPQRSCAGERCRHRQAGGTSKGWQAPQAVRSDELIRGSAFRLWQQAARQRPPHHGLGAVAQRLVVRALRLHEGCRGGGRREEQMRARRRT